MEEQKERWAIFVDGIKLPGFRTEAEAQSEIDTEPEFNGKKAIPVQLSGKPHEVYCLE